MPYVAIDGATMSAVAIGIATSLGDERAASYVPRVVRNCGVCSARTRADAIQSSSSWNHGRGKTLLTPGVCRSVMGCAIILALRDSIAADIHGAATRSAN